MSDELADALGRAEADGAVRAIVLTANGKDFCVGMDLSAGGVAGVDQPGLGRRRRQLRRLDRLRPRLARRVDGQSRADRSSRTSPPSGSA